MTEKKQSSIQNIWEKFSFCLVHFVEKRFYNLGVIVAEHPWITILLSWCVVLIGSFGLMRFHIEKNPIKLWVPPESDFYYDTNWYIDKFGTGFRFQRVLLKADNVLNPKALKLLYEITDDLFAIDVSYNNKTYKLNDLCYKVPVINIFSTNNAVKNMTDFSDPTLWVHDSLYCDVVEHFPQVCLQYNILDIWKKNTTDVFLKEDITSAINKIKINTNTGHPVDYSTLLGGVAYENGKIISAQSMLITWYTQVNMSEVDLDEVGNLVGTEEWVSIPLALWEQRFLDTMKLYSEHSTEVEIFYEAGRSFGDISGQAMIQEIDKLSLGIILMFFYIQCALSRFNWLELRLTLGSLGLLVVGMAYVSSVSFCSLLGINFGPVHSSLPFLLMGLGIDDMFVMKACWENLSPTESQRSLPFKVGSMLKHAGVSIVITSFTDVVALLIGAITVLPSLKSYCIYGAVGVFFIFCYSVTFYVAVFTLDIKRIASNRNGLLFCYKHKSKIRLPSGPTWFQTKFSYFYENIVFTLPAKIFVILFTIIMTGFSVQATLNLQERFDPKWFIPDGNYYKDFLNNYEHFYPEEGQLALVFFGEMDYRNEFSNLFNIVQDLKKENYVKDVDSWIEAFYSYVMKNFDRDLRNPNSITNDVFDLYLSRFLYSPVGGKYQVNFKFEQPFQCGQRATNITASFFTFRFSRFPGGPDHYLPAMHKVKDIVKLANISSGDGYRSVWSKVFGNWVTDEVIGVEVERNLELALLCVMFCTIILIANIQMCLWVFLCVLLTMVNVLGWMQRWGMTVDIVACIGLELAIGLCVDYAAHVGHTFLTIEKGTRSERAFKAVTSIGVAVLLGGGSTLLSLSLLSMSKAYTFQAFFKILLLVILFGLFNGLIFLPVVLSLLGPAPYRQKDKLVATESVQLNCKSDDPDVAISIKF